MFIQSILGIAAWLILPFKAIADRRILNKVVGEDAEPYSREWISCCYIYNPGLDITGVSSLSFGQINTIKGGVITRIDQVIEWTGVKCEDPSPQRQRVIRNFLGGLTDKHYGYEHPANEMVDNIITYHRQSFLVRLKEWDGKNVDIESINNIIYASTIQARKKAVINLPRRSSAVAISLKQYLTPVLHSYEKYAKSYMDDVKSRIKDKKVRVIDVHASSLACLLDIEPPLGLPTALSMTHANVLNKRYQDYIDHEVINHYPSEGDFHARVRARVNEMLGKDKG